MRGLFIAAAPAMIGLTAASAPAAITVFGNSNARSCYESALAERAGASDIRVCTDAIEDRETTGRDRVASHVNRGILYMQNGNYALAIADYDRAIALDAAEPDAYLNKALAMLHRQGAASDVIALMTTAIENGTREPALAYYGRGIAHEMAGDIPAAYYDIRRASEIAPEWDLPSRDLARFRVVDG